MKGDINMLATESSWRHRALGFTLVELMVSLAVLAVLISIAVPSFTSTIASNRMATQTNEFMAGLKLARAEAIRRGQGVAIQADVAGSPANFATGWTIFTNASADGVLASTASDEEGTQVRVSDPLAGNTSIVRVTRAGTGPAFTYAASTASDRRFVAFNGRGGNVNAAAFFRICDTGSNVPGRIVQVSAIGKITLDATDITCP
jgi:type IV fimbrial biogenesis protein FimT